MLLQHVVFALRTARKNVVVTVLAVLCLGIGIGLDVMMFSVTDGVLIQPLPYANPDRIIVLNATQREHNVRFGDLSWLDLQDWRDRARSFESLGGIQYRSFTISDGGGEPARYSGAAVSASVFPILGEVPQLGRTFSSDDDRPGGEPVVIIADDLWRLRYNSDRGIIGRAIQVNSRPHTVIGVMPPKFKFPENQYVWLPLSEYAVNNFRNARGLMVVGRLRDGVTLEQARDEAGRLAANLATTFPDTNRGWGALVRPLAEWAIPSDITQIILTMMGAVTLVLLIACFNVANLMLARASSRTREISIRAALGARRGQIVLQLLTESVIIGLLSVPLGMLCAWGGLRLIDLSIPPDSIPYFIQWHLDLRSFGYAVAVAAATGMVFGLAPALQASKADLQEALKEGGRGTAGTARGWMRNILVVAEVALSLLLLIGASLFMRSFVNLSQASGGFDTRPLMTLRFYMPNEQYATNEAKAQRVQDIQRRVEALPGVASAFASNMVPLGNGGGSSQVRIEGKEFSSGQEPEIEFIGASPHMLATLGLSVVRGRDLTDAESNSRSNVAIVNRAMAARFWPNQDPLGRRFFALDDVNGGWFTVVGIAPDFRHTQLDQNIPVEPCAYVSYQYGATPNTGLVIRVKGDPGIVSGPVREAIRAADPSIAVFSVATMEELRKRGYWQFALFGWMFSLYGGIALVLASIGVYGVLSYSVAQRTQEIGVRVALGASRRDVLALVVRQGLTLAIIGVLCGAVGSFFVTPVVKSQLYNVSPADPASFIAVSIFLMAVAFVASYVPARRATAVDPLIALRAE